MANESRNRGIVAKNVQAKNMAVGDNAQVIVTHLGTEDEDLHPSVGRPPFDVEVNDAGACYSCFISYSSKDEWFAERLRSDLESNGVRCWFAPHDLPIGAKTWNAIDEAIGVRDKLLLILSKHAIASDWVEDEVAKAFAEERRRNQLVLFPVRIDETVMTTNEPWAVKLRDQRNIGDFRGWQNQDAYRKTFDRVLRDLKPPSAPHA